MGVGACPYTPGGRNLRSARKFFSVLRCKVVATRETNESIRTATEAIRESAEVLSWCPGAESNHRHHDFQSRQRHFKPYLSPRSHPRYAA